MFGTFNCSGSSFNLICQPRASTTILTQDNVGVIEGRTAMRTSSFCSSVRSSSSMNWAVSSIWLKEMCQYGTEMIKKTSSWQCSRIWISLGNHKIITCFAKFRYIFWPALKICLISLQMSWLPVGINKILLSFIDNIITDCLVHFWEVKPSSREEPGYCPVVVWAFRQSFCVTCRCNRLEFPTKCKCFKSLWNDLWRFRWH